MEQNHFRNALSESFLEKARMLQFIEKLIEISDFWLTFQRKVVKTAFDVSR